MNYGVDCSPTNTPACTTYSAPFTLSDEGTHTISYYARDVAGNVESVKSFTVQIVLDHAPPVTTASAPTGWSNAPVSVSLSASDAGVGVAQTWYAVDTPSCTPAATSSCIQYSAPFTVSGEGAHTVTYFSVDKRGNVEAAQSTNVSLDQTAPVTSVSLPSALPDGTYPGDVTVSLTSSDALSGVAAVKYGVGCSPSNTAACATYNGPFTLSDDGVHTISYYATDLAGNAESVKSFSVHIVLDHTPPVTTANGPSGWVNTPATVTLSASDDVSGVDKTWYAVDVPACSPSATSSCTQYSGAIAISSDGVHNVTYFSVDKRGNVEAAQVLSVRIDQTAPQLTASATPDQLTPANDKLLAVNVAVSASDPAGSGISGWVLESITSNDPNTTADDFADWATGTADISGELRASRTAQLGDRVYTLTYRATDVAGNVTRATATVTVPKAQGNGNGNSGNGNGHGKNK